MNRRLFIKRSAASGVLAVAAGAGLLMPTRVLAAWPKKAFGSRSLSEVLVNLMGTDRSTPNNKITIIAPTVAESGATVPFKVSTTLPDVVQIAILVEENPSPLATTVALSGAGGYLTTRIKMAETSPVVAYVKSGGKLYTATQTINVSVGGCGG